MFNKDKSFVSFVLVFFLIIKVGFTQDENTVGVLELNRMKSFPGYNLIYPNHQSSVFLLDECGQIVNEWKDDDFTRPGAVAKLTPTGNLLKAKSSGEFTTPGFGAGGSGGIIEIYNWENVLLARRVVRDSIYRQHHDLTILPNGNVMCLAYERKFFNDIVEAGFDTLTNNQSELWFDCIFEFSPNLDSIVWEWHSWDHLIQDLDSTKSNYGNIKEHPERINFNYQAFAFGRADFMHSNAIDYNTELDQILISVRNFQEVWIVDHSPTSEQSSGSEGGNSNKGGDLLFRWGNPVAYKAGEIEQQKLSYQHDSKWVKDKSSKYYGNLLIYNNKIGDKISVGELILPIYDTINQEYLLDTDTTFYPKSSTREISHPDSLKNDSTHASSIQLLENGNFLICSAVQGRLFELTDEEEPVWEYVVPLIFGEPVPQGETISYADNFNSQVHRYSIDFSGFIGKDLSPEGYIELNPNVGFCMPTDLKRTIGLDKAFDLVNNPVENFLIITSISSDELFVINQFGELALQQSIIPGSNTIDVSNLIKGMYYGLNSEYGIVGKFIKL